jgi:hypothetical protein
MTTQYDVVCVNNVCSEVTYGYIKHQVYIRHPEIALKDDYIAIRGFPECCSCNGGSCKCFSTSKCCCAVYYFGTDGSLAELTMEYILETPPHPLFHLLNCDLLNLNRFPSDDGESRTLYYFDMCWWGKLNYSDEFLYSLYTQARAYPEYSLLVSHYIQFVLYIRINQLMKKDTVDSIVYQRLYLLMNDLSLSDTPEYRYVMDYI